MRLGYFFELQEFHRHAFVRVDRDGYLMTAYTDVAELTQFQSDILQDICIQTQQLVKSDLLCLYFRDADFVDRVSVQFDMIVIVKKDPDRYHEKLSHYYRMAIQPRYSFVKFFNVRVVTSEIFYSDLQLKFIAKVLAIRIFGPPMENSISRFKLSPEIWHSIYVLSPRLQLLDAAQKQHPILFHFYCRNLVRHAIRASFELIMERHKGYTRQVDLCLQFFCSTFPQHSILATRVFNYSHDDTIMYHSFKADINKFHEILLSLHNNLHKVRLHSSTH